MKEVTCWSRSINALGALLVVQFSMQYPEKKISDVPTYFSCLVRQTMLDCNCFCHLSHSACRHRRIILVIFTQLQTNFEQLCPDFDLNCLFHVKRVMCHCKAISLELPEQKVMQNDNSFQHIREDTISVGQRHSNIHLVQ